jgi:long-chain acyl-CoA synthetase
MYDFLWQYIEHWSSEDPDFPFLRSGDKTISAGEFDNLANNLAKNFLSYGVQKGDRIVTILPSCIEYALTLIAGIKIGAIITPMDVRYRAAELTSFIDHVKPKIIVSLVATTDNDILTSLKKISNTGKALENIKHIFTSPTDYGMQFSDAIKDNKDFDNKLSEVNSDLSLDDGALIIFTGGTTGIPKAVLLSNRNVTCMCVYECQFMMKHLAKQGVTGRIKTLAALPPSHVGGTLELIGTAIVGGFETILMEYWSPRLILKTTQDEKVPLIGGVPTMYAMMLSLPEIDNYDLSSIKLALFSGEKVSLELLEGIKSKICDYMVNGYGSTEAGSEITFTDPSDSLEMLADGYVGKPLPNVDIKIVDENENELPPYTQGEIIVKSPLTSIGYFNMPQEDVVGFTKSGYCRTGDLGYLTQDDGLFIKGRKKQIIRVGSYTVLPSEIEEVVLKDPSIAMAAAVGIPDKIYGEVICLFVAPEHNQTIDKDRLMFLCEKELANYKVPKMIIIKEDMPTTRIGKADREVLKKEYMERDGNN